MALSDLAAAVVSLVDGRRTVGDMLHWVSRGVEGTEERASVRESALTALSILHIDGAIEDHRLEGMDDGTAVAELTAVRGVGRWTAQWVLMRALGRTDVLPEGDLALRRVVSQLYYGGASIGEQQIAGVAMEHWHPYRGLATTYLFANLRRERVEQEQARADKGTALDPLAGANRVEQRGAQRRRSKR